MSVVAISERLRPSWAQRSHDSAGGFQKLAGDLTAVPVSRTNEVLLGLAGQVNQGTAAKPSQRLTS